MYMYSSLHLRLIEGGLNYLNLMTFLPQVFLAILILRQVGNAQKNRSHNCNNYRIVSAPPFPFAMLENGKMKTCVRRKCFVDIVQGWRWGKCASIYSIFPTQGCSSTPMEEYRPGLLHRIHVNFKMFWKFSYLKNIPIAAKNIEDSITIHLVLMQTIHHENTTSRHG